jgi:Flp pilus assembly protein TadG
MPRHGSTHHDLPCTRAGPSLEGLTPSSCLALAGAGVDRCSNAQAAHVAVMRAADAHSARRRSRGQALVEFALIAPLFFALLFGIIEYSLLSTAISALNFAAKDAARIGSLLGRTDPTADSQIVTDVRQHSAGIVTARVTAIEVFKADAAGNGVISGGSLVENVYDINGNALGPLGWPIAQRRDTLIDADYLGVRVSYTYTYLTGFISGGSASLPLTATSVQRIEPQDYQGNSRLPGTPPSWLQLAATSCCAVGLSDGGGPWL